MRLITPGAIRGWSTSARTHALLFSETARMPLLTDEAIPDLYSELWANVTGRSLTARLTSDSRCPVTMMTSVTWDASRLSTQCSTKHLSPTRSNCLKSPIRRDSPAARSNAEIILSFLETLPTLHLRLNWFRIITQLDDTD